MAAMVNRYVLQGFNPVKRYIVVVLLTLPGQNMSPLSGLLPYFIS